MVPPETWDIISLSAGGHSLENRAARHNEQGWVFRQRSRDKNVIQSGIFMELTALVSTPHQHHGDTRPEQVLTPETTHEDDIRVWQSKYFDSPAIVTSELKIWVNTAVSQSLFNNVQLTLAVQTFSKHRLLLLAAQSRHHVSITLSTDRHSTHICWPWLIVYEVRIACNLEWVYHEEWQLTKVWNWCWSRVKYANAMNVLCRYFVGTVKGGWDVKMWVRVGGNLCSRN